MSKHTPGPWHVGQGNGEGSIFTDEGRMRLGEGGTTLYPIATVIDFAGERDANAQLIAAAPDLLVALLDALPYVEDVLDNPEHLACFKKGTVQKHANAIRAAINKATNSGEH